MMRGGQILIKGSFGCNSEFKWPFQIMAIIARKWPSCEWSSQTAVKHTEKCLAVDFLEL
jgi:hypothetical protein